MTNHIVTFGELLMRLAPSGDERLLQSALLHTSFGGAEANVAVGVAQFGVPVEYVTRVPANPIADAALRAMRADGVGTRGVVRGGDRLGLYFLERGADLRPLRSVYDRAGSAFATLDPNGFDFASVLHGASWLHLTGIVAALGAGPAVAATRIMEVARSLGVKVSFDLNYRPALWSGRDPRPLIEPLAARADLLIGNPGAMSVMLGETTRGTIPEPPDALLETAIRVGHRFGCGRVAITQRDVLSASTHGWQAWLWEAAHDVLHHGGRYEVRLVDRVGGGDAFVAGLLASLHENADAARAVRFATAAGAHKLTVPGDFPRTTREEIARMTEDAL